jgi:CheY-like chemotaxis protein
MTATVRGRSAPMVLVVDDEAGVRGSIAAELEASGYGVSTAPNGKVALEQARATRPDLIVLDLVMPVMDGWQFLHVRRGDPTLAAVPVVVLTACAVSLVEGAAVLLRKPLDVDALLAAAARLTSAPDSLPASIYGSGERRRDVGMSPMVTVTVCSPSGGAVVRVAGSFDASDADQLWSLTSALDAGGPVTIDFHEVRSAGDLAIARLATGLLEHSHQVSIVGLSEHQHRLLRYIGLELDGGQSLPVIDGARPVDR